MTHQDSSLPASPRSRWLSAAELGVAATAVIGHNVFHLLPNEVPVLVVLALVSVRLREKSWSALGFRRPSSWRLVGLLAVGFVAVRWGSGALVEAITAHFWPPIAGPKGVDEIVGNPLAALAALGLVWTFAAFGEEIGYRGYIMKRAADAGGGGRIAWVLALVVASVLFGYGHYYKGPAGVLDSGISGLLMGAVFLASGRSLWTTILAHGLSDTLAVTLTYLGLDN
ncbi:CPBP family intramembrane glutamic endopeptidase [Phenylobacterium sp.]|uniref:CPBP family intramembrane glutamic endopeptidase n=1 Tax=Phenylobacterium sp. TaxID=1871053 RepID=UPI003561CC46